MTIWGHLTLHCRAGTRSASSEPFHFTKNICEEMFFRISRTYSNDTLHANHDHGRTTYVQMYYAKFQFFFSLGRRENLLTRVAIWAISSPKMSKAGAMGTLLAIKIYVRRYLRFGDNAGDLGKASRISKSPFITIFFRTQNTYGNPDICWSAPVAGGPRRPANGLCRRR